MADAVADIPISTVEHLIRSMQISQYGVAIMASAFMYDFLTALDREVEYVWKGKRSLTKLLFLSNRYNAVLYFGLNLLLQFVPSKYTHSCQVTTYIDYLIGLHVMLVGTVVLFLRTWALFDRNWRFLITFTTVYSITVIGLMVLTVKAYFWGGVAYTYGNALDQAIVSAHPSLEDIGTITLGGRSDLDALFMGCYFTGYPKEFFAIFLGALFFESVLFSLTMYQLWRLHLSTGLVAMMFRDGLIYYVLIMTAHLCATVIARSDGIERALLGSSFFIGIKSIAVSHLILRLRGYLILEPELNTVEPTAYDQPTNIRFAPPALNTTAFGSTGDGVTVSEGYELKEREGFVLSKPSDLEVGSSSVVNTQTDS